MSLIVLVVGLTLQTFDLPDVETETIVEPPHVRLPLLLQHLLRVTGTRHAEEALLHRLGAHEPPQILLLVHPPRLEDPLVPVLEDDDLAHVRVQLHGRGMHLVVARSWGGMSGAGSERARIWGLPTTGASRGRRPMGGRAAGDVGKQGAEEFVWENDTRGSSPNRENSDFFFFCNGYCSNLETGRVQGTADEVCGIL